MVSTSKPCSARIPASSLPTAPSWNVVESMSMRRRVRAMGSSAGFVLMVFTGYRPGALIQRQCLPAGLPHLHFSVPHAHFETWLGMDRRAVDDVSVGKVEPRLVPRTHDAVPNQFAFRQR